jgi:hypothetical protein
MVFDRDERRELHTFAEQATFAELIQRQGHYCRIIAVLQGELRHDYQARLRIIEDEIAARLEVSAATGKPPR